MGVKAATFLQNGFPFLIMLTIFRLAFGMVFEIFQNLDFVTEIIRLHELENFFFACSRSLNINEVAGQLSHAQLCPLTWGPSTASVTILWTQKGCLLCELDCRHVCIRCLSSLLNIKMFIGPVAWPCISRNITTARVSRLLHWLSSEDFMTCHLENLSNLLDMFLWSSSTVTLAVTFLTSGELWSTSFSYDSCWGQWSSACHKKSGPFIHCDFCINSLAFIPLDASSAVLDPDSTLGHWSVEVWSQMNCSLFATYTWNLWDSLLMNPRTTLLSDQ